MSVDECLEFERASPVRHAYHRGEIFAMAGATPSHSELKWRLAMLLGSQLQTTGRRGFDSDMRVKIEASGLSTYPDDSVTCQRPRFERRGGDSLLNPQVIFEVLSKSTELYDRTRKFDHDQAIPTLRHYVLASQARPKVDVFTRDEDGRWTFRTYGPGGPPIALEAMEAIQCQIALDDLYAGIELRPEEEAPDPTSHHPPD